MITLRGLVIITSIAPAQLPLMSEIVRECDPVFSTKNFLDVSYASHPRLAEKMFNGDETRVPRRSTRVIPPSIEGITLVNTLNME
jgi:hypothetical protein